MLVYIYFVSVSKKTAYITMDTKPTGRSILRRSSVVLQRRLSRDSSALEEFQAQQVCSYMQNTFNYSFLLITIQIRYSFSK